MAKILFENKSKMSQAFGFLFLLGFSAHGIADSAENLQTKLQTLKSMSAHFSQTVTSNRRSISTSSGSMALLRPGRFRWQTNAPMPQLVVANGTKIWIYDEQLEQVTVKRQAKEVGGTAGVFLSSAHNNISRDFKVTESRQGANTLYDLQAKSHKESIQHLKLLFAKDVLTGIELFDQLGQRTKIRLNQIKTNVALSNALFQFKIPKGVDVVQQ